MKNKLTKNFISILVFLFILILPASDALAAIELHYVNAEQYFVNEQNQRINLYGVSVAQLIVSEAAEHNINPRMIIAIMQRESSAITQPTPSSTTREAWSMFYNYDETMADCLYDRNNAACADAKYGKPDYRWRAENYGGVGQQIAYSIYNFNDLYNSYKDGYNNPIQIDGQTITCENVPTRLLYAYTPHISAYTANSNFYKYYLEYWGEPPTTTLSVNNVISEANFRNTSPMTAEQVQTFLTEKGSWLASYGTGNLIPQFISVPYPVYISPAPSRKAGDSNDDGQPVGISDLSILGDTWDQNVAPNTGADFDGDGHIGLRDLSILGDNWER